MSAKHYLKGVFRGGVQQRYGLDTAINKSPIKDEVYLGLEGLEGDECADTRHHGGVDRALHQYPSEHYLYWLEKYGLAREWHAPGMGENLSSEGMTEDTVCLGDRYRWGKAIIEVSQPRSPCFKLNRRWEISTLSVDMQSTSHCGWLYRVVQPSLVSVDQPLVLEDRVIDALTIRDTCNLFFGAPLDSSALNQLLKQARLSESWMSKVRQRLETGEVENWNFRLLGHA